MQEQWKGLVIQTPPWIEEMRRTARIFTGLMEPVVEQMQSINRVLGPAFQAMARTSAQCQRIEDAGWPRGTSGVWRGSSMLVKWPLRTHRAVTRQAAIRSSACSVKASVNRASHLKRAGGRRFSPSISLMMGDDDSTSTEVGANGVGHGRVHPCGEHPVASVVVQKDAFRRHGDGLWAASRHPGAGK